MKSIDPKFESFQNKILTVQVVRGCAVRQYIPLYCSVDKEGFQIPYNPYKPLKVVLKEISEENGRTISITSNLSETKLSRESELPTAYVVSGKDLYIERFAQRTGKTTYINSNIYNEYAFNLSKMMKVEDYLKILNSNNEEEMG